MSSHDEVEHRIRERAHRLWEAEGRPEGRAALHWEQARAIIALEDNHEATLLPPSAASAEHQQTLSPPAAAPIAPEAQ